MKLIDKNGKLFGLVNIIDTMVIIFLLLLVPIFYFGYKVLYTPARIEAAKEEKKVYGDIEMYCKFVDVTPDVAKKIKVGDKELDESDRTIAEVLTVERIAPFIYQIDLGDGVVVRREKKEKKEIWTKMRFVGEYKDNELIFKGFRIADDNMIFFATPRYKIKGIVKDEIEPEIKSELRRKSLFLDVVFRNLDKDTAEKINKGDVEIDEEGKVISKIINVCDIKPEMRLIDLGGGNIITEIDRDKLQLWATLEVIGELVDESIFFKGRKFRYNTPIAFNTEKYSVAGEIAKPGEKLKPQIGSVVFNVVFNELDNEIAEKIKEGDREIGEDGEILNEIIGVEHVLPFVREVDLGGRQIMKLEEPDKSVVWTKVNFFGIFRGRDFIYKGRVLGFNDSIAINTDKYSITGRISLNPFQEPPVSVKQYGTIALHVSFKGLDQKTAEMIKVGDTELSEDGEPIAKILEVVNIRPMIHKLDLGRGNISIKEDPLRKEVIAKVQFKGEMLGDTLKIRGVVLRTDALIVFRTNDYVIEGCIVEEEEWKQYGTIALNALFKGLSKEVAEMIKVGDVERGEDGEPIAQILEVGEIRPMIHKIDLGGGNISIKEDPLRKEVMAKVQFRGEMLGDILKIEGVELKADAPLTFRTNGYVIKGRIIEKEKEKPISEVPTPKKQYGTVSFNVLFKGLDQETAEMIKVGDTELGEDEEPIAKVLKVGQIRPMIHRLDLGGGNIISKEDPTMKEVMTKILFRGEISSDTLKMKGIELKTGIPLALKTDKYTIQGRIIEEKEAKPLYKYKASAPKKQYGTVAFNVLFKGLDQETAEMIKVGDTELSEDGESIAKILKVSEIRPMIYKIDLGGGKIVTKEDPSRREVIAKISFRGELASSAEESVILLKEIKIRQDSPITFRTDKYDITGYLIIPKQYALVQCLAEVPSVAKDTADLISKGDILKTDGGEKLGEITKVLSKKNYEYKITTEKGRKKIVADKYKKAVTVKVELVCELMGKFFYCGEQEIRQGSTIAFATDEYTLRANIKSRPKLIKRYKIRDDI